jgi:hypothetical protein
MASPRLYVRADQRLFERVLQAAEAEGLTISGFVRRAILDRLEDSGREAAERAALLAQARKFLAAHRDGGYEVSIVERLAGFLEEVGGRISKAEQHGRRRALAEVAAGSLEALAPDGEVLELADFRLRSEADLPVILETPPPRRRGFLRLSLVEERARELLATVPEPAPVPSAAGLLGEASTRELWNEAVGWPGWRRLYCPVHGVVPSAPSNPDRCYLGCRVSTGGDGPKVA